MNRRSKKIKQGSVVSDKANKSILVLVERVIKHPLYKRTVKRSKKYMAHDELNSCQIGDVVRIIECRPISRRKRWRLFEVVQSKTPQNIS